MNTLELSQFSSKKSMFRVFIMFVFVASKSLGNYQIIFDKAYSPARNIPPESSMYYSVPLNQEISKPIFAYFVDSTGTRDMDGPLSNTVVQVFTIDVNTSTNENIKDKWKDSGGSLCQTAVVDKDYPERVDRSKAITRCGSYPEKTALSVQTFKGRVILDGIFHQHSSVPEHARIIRIVCHSPKLTADSYPFLITIPADHLVISKLPPSNIIANHPFKMTATILDQNGLPVTRGLDSIAYVDLIVPYYYKTFYNTDGRKMMLKQSLVRLSGDTIYHQSIEDRIIRKRASKGVVSFNDIRILDTIANLQLNLTMTMARFPWTRIPNCASCYDDVKYITLKSNGTEVTFPNLGAAFYKKIKPMVLTKTMNILAQTASYLKVANHTLQEWKKWVDPKINAIRIARNIPIPGTFTVHLLDTNSERIYSGPDADLNLKYTTIPSGVCISNDATKQLRGGGAHLFVSICQLITKVKLIVSIVNKKAITVATPDLKVEGILHIAHLGDFKDSRDGVRIDSDVNNFISSAISEINQGLIVRRLTRSGLKLNLISVDTGSKVEHALSVFYNLTEFAFNPVSPVQGIISSTKEDITFALNPQLTATHIPYISTVNSAKRFSDNSEYPYINRVCWSDSFIITSVLKMAKERNWMMLIILREMKITLSRNFRLAMKSHNINIEKELAFPEMPDLMNTDPDYYFAFEMNQIAKWKCRIIFLFANGKMQSYILRAAYLKQLDTDHGYQWVIIGRYAWEFPFQDQGVCARGPKKCTDAFRGTLLIGETYNITTNNRNWIRVLDRYFATDKYERQMGIVEYRSLAVNARKALGYDATLLLAYSINKLVLRRRSLTGSAVNQNIRNMHIKGLTGNIQMNSYGDRLGYIGFLAQVNPLSPEFIYLRLLMLDDLEEQIEVPFESILTNVTAVADVILPISPQYNLRSYTSYTGMVNLATQRLVQNPNEPWPPMKTFRTEKVLPSFICNHSCGFNPTDESDVNIYDSGRCTHNGECQCRPGYAGKNCTIVSCQECVNGDCISPEVCQCYPGWGGNSCNRAYCDSCVLGSCDWPDKCTCFPHAIGRNCSIYVAAVVVPLIVGILLLFVISYFCVKKFLVHSRQRSALNNISWVVHWSAVECCQPENSYISRTSVSKRSLTLLTSQLLETYKWKNEKWYVIPIPNSTISLDDVSVRLEMVELTQIKHVNLIKVGGACLIAPNVTLFSEVAQKGSLNDVLHLTSFDLGWEFRYSFMKDICSGMRYLHEETQIGSHGRLKSHNCLIDSHWTIKISGFGAPSIRMGKYRQPREEHSEDLKNLLWTAPELLGNANCLDEIKNGTKDGDVYSFAIIISEILTWADPYEYELEYISERALLDLIKDPFDCENYYTRLKWKAIGGSNMLAVRPILREEHLAQTVLRRKMTRHILAEAWDQVPASRPSFKKLHLMLEECYPASGGLIDNLINLLSSYSNNLEMIVLERTREIEESKEKSEHLLTQLLPSNIADELKRGRKVAPELFECVTVFFSDIVDFTEILMESTPFQIVEFLNDMYNAFDNTVLKYNVYKVETICDTYIVVSGLPERIGPQHAGEIATMSLHLLSLVTEFKIKHRPNATLQLRIGVHSGPVVSGIVGTMMPRYCLFGDTVNTASRMESSSISLRIQISDTTADILKQLGGYHLISRGMRDVKGRGLMRTYWLNGKNGFYNVLPDQSLAIPLSRHRFK